MDSLLTAILEDDVALVKKLLKRDPALVSQRVQTAVLHQSKIFHWLYVGDTALHLAAAGYRVEIVNALIAAGADPNAAFNHRRGTPLHYAADGFITGPAWNEKRQLQTIAALLKAGACNNFQDKNGATALHRATRNRCAGAVKALLNAQCDPNLTNKPGSTAFHLAVQNTGRGGSGAEESRVAQRQIIDTFLAFGVSTAAKDGNGNTVLECARRSNVIDLLSQ